MAGGRAFFPRSDSTDQLCEQDIAPDRFPADNQSRTARIGRFPASGLRRRTARTRGIELIRLTPGHIWVASAAVLVVALLAMPMPDLASVAAGGGGGLPPGLVASFNNSTNGSSSSALVLSPQAPLGPSSFGVWDLLDQNSMRTGGQLAERTLSAINASLIRPVWPAPYKVNGSIAGSLAVDNWTAYFGDWSGALHSLNVSATPPPNPWNWNYSRTGLPMVNCTGNTYARGITSTPVLWHNLVIVGAGDRNYKLKPGIGYGWVIAVNASGPHKGTALWATNLSNYTTHGAWTWTYTWSSPVVYNGTVLIGLASGCDQEEVQGQLDQLNAMTGAVEHIFNVTPTKGQSGPIWSSPSVDAGNNTVWVTTGNDEPGSTNTYSRSIVALNLSDISQVRGWLQVGVANQDQDFGAGPTLFSSSNGTPLVGAINKDGYLYVAERAWFTNHSGGPVQVTQPLWQRQVSLGYATAPLANGNGLVYAGGGHSYSGWERYTYSGLPPGCSSQNTSDLSCSPTSAAHGPYTVSVSVTDNLGHNAWGNLSVTANPTSGVPQIDGFSGIPVGVGSPTTISTTVVGGAPPLTYSYSGLPSGCSSVNSASFSCTPTSSGDFSITVTVTDFNHNVVSSTSTLGITPLTGSSDLIDLAEGSPATVTYPGVVQIGVFSSDSYLVENPGTVRALYPGNGTAKWIHVSPGLVRAGVTYADGLVIDAATSWNFSWSTIEVLNAATGALLYELNVSGQVPGEPVVADGRIYFGTAGGSGFSGPGYLYALGIAVAARPIVTAKGWTTSPLVGDYVNFIGGGAGGSPPYTCVWELRFGGKSIGCGLQYDFFPALNATYYDKLWVNDSMGDSANYTYQILIVVGHSPCVSGPGTSVCIASAIIGNLALNVACIVPVVVCDRTIAYNATVLGGTHPYTYRWTFGDGGSSGLANPSHTYSEAGDYTISLTVTDARGVRTQVTTVLVLA
jgi:hypothetical protein